MKFPTRRFSLLPALALAAVLAWPVSELLAAQDRAEKTTPLMRSEVRALVQMLEYFHYNKGAVTSKDYPLLVTEFMAELDPQHLFFTAADEEHFRTHYGQRLETDLEYLGNIDASFDIFRVYQERVESRARWIGERLQSDFDLASDLTYHIDRAKAAWPADMKDADDLWMRRIRFELIQEMLGKKSAADAKSTVRKRYERMVKNVAEIEPFEVQETYLSTLTKLYDPHSAYFSADTLEDFSIQMRLSLVGIGAVLGLEEDGYCMVREVVPGGPADLSGQIKVNDKIIAVQQAGEESVEVIGMKLRRIVEMIRGKKDSKVILTVLPRDATDPNATKRVEIVRDVIKLNSARAYGAVHEVPAKDGTIVPIGVVTLNNFYGGPEDGEPGTRNTVTQDVAELIGKLRKEGVKGLVIDLRRNGGGLLSEAINLTGLFIPKGPVVQVRDSLGRLTVDNDDDAAVAYDGPLVVLTSRFSASASEIFAGALQNYGRAVIVGDSSTHGKGTVQAVLEMKNYLPRLSPQDASKVGAAKLTIQKFYLPNGVSTQQKGVVPDIALPSFDDYLPIGESDLPRALVWDEIRSTPFAGLPLPKDFSAALLAASVERQGQLEEFSFLKRDIEWRKRKLDDKDRSLNLARRQAEKEADDAFVKQMEAERGKLAKANYTMREIKLDSVATNAAATPSKPTTPVHGGTEDSGDTDAPGDESAVVFDIHLREALRVTTDSLSLVADPRYSANGVTPLIGAARPRSGKG